MGGCFGVVVAPEGRPRKVGNFCVIGISRGVPAMPEIESTAVRIGALGRDELLLEPFQRIATAR